MAEGREATPCEQDCTIKEWPHDRPCKVQQFFDAGREAIPPVRYIEDQHDAQPMTWKEGLLGQALANVLVKAGLLDPEQVFTGPQLLLAAEDFCETPPAREQ